jgi:uncharacterized protein
MREEFKLFVGKDQQFYIHLEAGNNKIILKGSEGYTTKDAALNGIESIRENSQIDERFQRFKDKRGEPMFRLIAGNNKIIGVSESYSSDQMMEKGIASVKRYAPIAPLVDDSVNQSNGNNFVTITIKDKDYEIHRGSQTVEAIKLLGSVPVGYTLVLLDGNDVKPLPNDGKVTIKGGEVFDCTPPNGTNS